MKEKQNSEHTPGPWYSGCSITTGLLNPRDYSSFKTVAQRVNHRGDMDLIAAAPDLAYALKKLMAAFEVHCNGTKFTEEEGKAMDAASSALVKAGIK